MEKIKTTPAQREAVHNLLDAVLDAYADGNLHVFFWMGNSDPRSTAFVKVKKADYKHEDFINIRNIKEIKKMEELVRNADDTSER